MRRAVSWKVFWAALGSAATLTLGVLGVTVAHPLGVGALTVVAGVAVAVVSRRLVFTSPMFLALTVRAREQMARWLTAACLAHMVWVAAFLLRPALWLVWLLALAVLAGCEVGLARAWEWQLARPVVEPVAPAGAARAVDPSATGQPAQVLSKALDRAGLDRVTVVKAEPIVDDADGETIGHRFMVRVPPGKKPTATAKATED